MLLGACLVLFESHLRELSTSKQEGDPESGSRSNSWWTKTRTTCAREVAGWCGLSMIMIVSVSENVVLPTLP